MKTDLHQLSNTTAAVFRGFWWPRIISFLFFIIHFSSTAFGQIKEWDKTIGGGDLDELNSLQQTEDGGYILGGSSFSLISGDKTGSPIGLNDYWVVKLDMAGNKVWDRTVGGSASDVLKTIQQTSDGGYILGGRSNSPISGDKTEDLRGSYDYWVVKLNAAGEKEWDKTFGGSLWDELNALKQTDDGGYILGGRSNSPVSGDKTGDLKGIFDFWVVKLDSTGEMEWDKTLGGNEWDELSALQQTSDGGYILGGHSSSGISEDKTEDSKGFQDFWVVKLDAEGNRAWDRTIGGNSNDRLKALQQTSDGGFILGGSSISGISGDKTEASRELMDYWVVKLNSAGEKQWDKTLGGNNFDELSSLQQTSDEGYILGGYSVSGISGDKTEANKGNCFFFECPGDYWVVKLDSTGKQIWDKTLGGPANDALNALELTSDGGFIVGGTSSSDISGDKTEPSKGFSDYWVVKLKEVEASICDMALTTQITQAESWYGMWGPLNGAGAIDLTVTGGTAPYTYLWNANLSTEDILVASPGFYSVTVTDAKGCTAITNVFVSRKNGTMTLATSHINVSSTGSQNGSIDLSVLGGTMPFSYRWSNGATTEDLTGLAAGEYNVIVTDALGHIATTSVTVSEPEMALTLTSALQDVSKAGTNDGAIDLTVIGGVGPFSYRWNNGATTQDLPRVVAGLYTVTVIDASGAEVSDTMQVMAPGLPSVATTKTPSLTEELSLKEIGFTVYPNPVKSQATVMANLASAGKYSLEIFDIRGAKIKTITVGQGGGNKTLALKVDFSGYANGMYLLKLFTEKGVAVKRITVEQ